MMFQHRDKPTSCSKLNPGEEIFLRVGDENFSIRYEGAGAYRLFQLRASRTKVNGVYVTDNSPNAPRLREYIGNYASMQDAIDTANKHVLGPLNDDKWKFAYDDIDYAKRNWQITLLI
jgi:hypothetical protein